MPVIRWIMNHMVIVFVTVLVVAGLAYQDQIEQEMVQLGWMDAPKAEVTEVASVSASTATPSAPSATTAPEVEAPVAAAEAPTADAPSQMPTHLSAQAPAAAPAAAAAPAPASAQAPAQAPAQAQAPVQQPYGYAPQGYGPRYGQAPQGYAQAPQGYAPRQMMGQMGPRQMGQGQMGQGQMGQGQMGRGQMGPAMQAPQMPTPPSLGADVGLDDAIKEQWSAARTAYWERDLEKAEELYKALVESSTEADVAGELGNIYFVQGRHEDAAAMFYEAGLRHLKGDNPVRAGIVMGPLSQLDREKANDLREKMMKIHRAQVEAQIEAQKKAQAELMAQQPEQTKN
ncbi:tol-pal system YbgF family protein [Pseudomonadota bacterium]